MATIESFFVKDGYQINETAKTFEDQAIGEYWTEERVANAALFQYHVYQLAAEIFEQNEYSSFVDIGCGPATKVSKFIAPIAKQIILIDQPNCKAVALKRVPSAVFYEANLESCETLVPHRVDLIVCADVLEHLYNPLACLELVKRLLKPTGRVIFSTPERDILRGKNCYISPHQAHVREWNSAEFRKLLEYAGFSVTDQLLLPFKKLSVVEEAIRKVLNPIIPVKAWKSCQMAICKLTN